MNDNYDFLPSVIIDLRGFLKFWRRWGNTIMTLFVVGFVFGAMS